MYIVKQPVVCLNANFSIAIHHVTHTCYIVNSVTVPSVTLQDVTERTSYIIIHQYKYGRRLRMPNQSPSFC